MRVTQSTDQMVTVVPYSSEIQQPMRARLSWAAIHTRTGLHRSTASRAVPLVCIQKARGSSPLSSTGQRPNAILKAPKKSQIGRTKTEVRDKLKKLQAEADAGLKTSASYTVAKAVDDWAAEALDGLADKTVRSHVDLLRSVTMLIGNIPLRDLTAHDVRRALNKLAETR